MLFGYSGEQMLLRETARRLCEKHARTVRGVAPEGTCSAALHADVAESGLPGLCLPETMGGAGLGAVEAAAVMVEAGRFLLRFPMTEQIAAGAAIAGSSHQELAADLLGGSALATVAWQGSAALRPDGRCDSVVTHLPWAHVARWLVLPLRLADGSERCALVDLASPGVERRPMAEPLDASCPLGEVRLAGVAIDEASLLPMPPAALRRLGALLISAEMLGAAEACLDRAVDYLRTREQFGQPIGRFQALKHIAADDALAVENMRNALLYAAWAEDAGAEDAPLAVHGAKALISDAAREVAEHATQIHGGMGYTWDLGLHFHMRRILRGALTHGSAEQHREAIAAMLLAAGPAGEALRTP